MDRTDRRKTRFDIDSQNSGPPSGPLSGNHSQENLGHFDLFPNFGEETQNRFRIDSRLNDVVLQT